ncbi:MAG: hypothetical protein KatS3mg109_1122 [Pirellulaceae bacterium]|nr:MAG: hypothetical protein KatS3mg109_1122 [Pirellulaceae bacterium]
MSETRDAGQSCFGQSPAGEEAPGNENQKCWGELYGAYEFPVGALVRAVTDDGLRLDGFWQPCPHGAPDRAVVFVHGAGSNFYSGGMWDALSGVFHQAGYGVLRINTRGHDGHYVARSAAGVVRMGAAYECVADAVRDLAAWCQWLEEQRVRRIVWVGHSLGAIKVLYAGAYAPPSAVSGIIALSAPRLSCRLYQEVSPVFQATLLEAKERVARGEGESLIESRFPFPMLITAASFLDKYGGEQYNILTFTHRIPVKTALIYGELEVADNPSFAGLPEAFQEQARGGVRLRVEVISGADHFYTGRFEVLGERIKPLLQWIET